MPFNLPPPWDPGYAIPDNVRDEGLERRAYVTKWSPRGTYDDPRVRSGGYVVPQYVKDEGYGQGTFTTKWMPRGTYNGPRVPQWIQRQPRVVAQKSLGPRAAEVTFQRTGYHQGWSGFGDDDASSLPDLYQQYGQRAADSILAAIARVAPPQRKQALKAIMDRVDPTLYKRTADIVRQYVARGLTAAQVFPTALARALAAGIAAETVRLGQTGEAPQPNSLLGLGCYGCSAALGALPATGLLNSLVGFAQTAAAGAAAPGNAPTDMTGKMQVGPLLVSADPHHVQIVTIRYPVLPSTGPWGDFVKQFNARLTDPKALAFAKAHPHQSGMMGLQVLPAPQNPFWQLFGVKPGQPVLVNVLSPAPLDGNWKDSDDGSAVPIVTFQHPVSGSKWGIFVAMMPTDTSGDTMKVYPTTSVAVYAKWLPDKPWYDNIAGSIMSVPAKILTEGAKVVSEVGGAVGDAVKELGQLACQVAQNSGGLNGPAAAAAMKAGPGAAAGVAGAAVAASMCAKPQLPQYPVMPPTNILPLAILGGGLLLATIVLTKKKKGTAKP